MYIPKMNAMTDREEMVAFMKRFSFATIITARENFPTATHLPFLISVHGDKIILTSHFARANEQWAAIGENKVLVIFTEPHAYISPKNYDKELNVPTWNYISIHAYGQGKFVTQTDKVIEILEKTIHSYEMAYMQQWNSLPEDFKLKMIKGIVAFEIEVTELQAKKKLSQNKTEAEQRSIINSLSGSDNDNEKHIADYMKRNIEM
ncbi:FMN-binding negative transcriptional regulator [Agriterribacter sp.]|uniref:FMN-binding negative transcriptional regulator n=1 Tax=Agriterribacter sp. TaxID=2821509 RepID=UPI002CD819B7|nr:FMN-binding negative transcriptional regulator [Agriterribacter sp.]HRO48359.1 FMN-binding negative transcriptional regulator [Agriterribacter sp.]HRQ19562.1 FMN-binding negative transcriptional regulator [Agriterribacter sp.]